jgi:hypothetical protein
VVREAPEGFGQEPDKYYSDVAFLKGVSSEKAMQEFEPHPEVDTVWSGPGVVYHRRLAAKLNESRLGRVTSKPVYQNMTIRSWSTVCRLESLLNQPK